MEDPYDTTEGYYIFNEEEVHESLIDFLISYEAEKKEVLH